MSDEHSILRYQEVGDNAFPWEIYRRVLGQFHARRFPPGFPVDRRLFDRHLDEFDNLFDKVFRAVAKGYRSGRGALFHTYLAKSLKNKLWTWLERHSRRQQQTEDLGREAARRREETPGQDPAWLVERLDFIQWLDRRFREAFLELPEQDRDIIERRRVKGQSYVEIAEAYGISEEACRARFSRAMQRLKGLMGHEE